ncbi:MAG: adenylate/guanylate cyclase domain-containing protein [Dehalococcoidia bacterium]|nr:adenylate/guanylate cyclase domain-containing protein [Dehalococcoidia bacterium]
MASTRALEGTVVFTDIVGFTEYTALRGDEEALELLSRQERLVRELLPPGARVVKELGDGLLLWFDDACAAIETAFRLQERLEDESGDAMTPLWVRIGIHTGRQTRRGEDLVGHDVNVAARVVDVAGPSEVLLSEATRTQIEGRLPDVSFEELGPVVMKGIPEPVRLYRALPAA